MLECIIGNYDGGPVGIDTIAAAISEERDTIEDVYEPYLMQLGFLGRTPRGRVATKLAYEHLGIFTDREMDNENETITIDDNGNVVFRCKYWWCFCSTGGYIAE